MSADPAEKRRHARFPSHARAWIADGEHTLYLRVHDLSLGGLSVRAPVPFAANDVIEVRLELPGGIRVRARGEVRWVRETAIGESGARMGAEFTDFEEGEEDLHELLGHA